MIISTVLIAALTTRFLDSGTKNFRCACSRNYNHLSRNVKSESRKEYLLDAYAYIVNQSKYYLLLLLSA